ncbi:MAG: DNA cytosine methyltransferase [Firmicutes bacterium]|nr:DNA cytosine methyltransferase [Bacillota bacterium]
MKQKRYYISLFTGAGGLDIGFKEAGFKGLFASDIMPQAKESYQYNYPEDVYLLEDIRTLSLNTIKSYVGDKKVSIIIGGPPCQGFSNMGNKNSADPRNLLFESYVNIVEAIQPDCFLFENVKGLKTMFEGRYFQKVVEAFLNIGYNLHYSLIDTSNYGVPQKRERIFIFGTKLKRQFLFPAHSDTSYGTIKAYKNVGEAINDLIDKDQKFPNQIPLRHSDKVIRRYQLIPEGGKLPKPEELPEDIRRRNFGNTYTRLDRASVSSTIVPGNNALPVHPTLDRSLTPREGARIQTFPDGYIFKGDRRSQCIQVGNAVPPLMSAKLAEAVRNYLDGIDYEGIIPEKSFFYEEADSTISLQNTNTSRATLKFGDLFSGAGGFTKGLEQAGLECVLGAEYNEYAAEAYRKNFSHECLQIDLSTIENQNLVAQRLKEAKVDLVVGGPPCQGFSIFGNRRFVNTKNWDVTQDERNDLVFAFSNIVVKSEAPWFIMENVPAILSARNGEYVKAVETYFNEHGYRTEYRVINAADYGAPQLRRRFIMIGTKTDLVFPWPKPKYYENPEAWQLPYRTVEEVLTDLIPVESQKKHYNHKPSNHNKIVTERFSYIKEGKKMDVDALPEHLKIGSKTGKPVSNFSHVFYRLDRKKPSPTIVPGHNALPVHPTLNRTLTVREAARIQTFPDDVEFVGPIINQCLQVGNAFPCIVGQTFGERLRTVINKEWSIHSTTMLAKKSMLEE